MRLTLLTDIPAEVVALALRDAIAAGRIRPDVAYIAQELAALHPSAKPPLDVTDSLSVGGRPYVTLHYPKGLEVRLIDFADKGFISAFSSRALTDPANGDFMHNARGFGFSYGRPPDFDRDFSELWNPSEYVQRHR